MEMNTCNYSIGALNPHEACTHPNYCLFDPKRIMVEKELVYLEYKYNQTLKDYNFIQEEGTSNSKDYAEVKHRLKIIEQDYDNLKAYEDKLKEDHRSC